MAENETEPTGDSILGRVMEEGGWFSGVTSTNPELVPEGREAEWQIADEDSANPENIRQAKLEIAARHEQAAAEAEQRAADAREDIEKAA